MTGRLEGKIALVTAAGQGIGRAIAEAYVRDGARVIATDLDVAKLEGLKGAEVRALDVRSTDAVNALAKDIGPVHILSNNAGYVHQGTIFETSEKDWDFSFDLNVTSIHRTISAFLPGMLEAGGGSIVNIASAASSIRGVPNRYVYGTTKAAIDYMTRQIAADYAKEGIVCNAVAPGKIVTGQGGRLLDEDVLDRARRRTPWPRFGRPEDVARAALFLASDEASFITGETLMVDGGWMAA